MGTVIAASAAQTKAAISDAPSRRLDSLDGLRCLAALYVVLFHAGSEFHDCRWPVSAIQHVFDYGHYAVDLFIVLSGFSLMLPIVRSGKFQVDASRFFYKRARRILPPYYATLAISILLAETVITRRTGSVWDNAIPVTKFGILTHIFLVQDVFSATFSQINHSLWSIAVEWRIYFAFPLLVWMWRKIGPKATVAAAVAASFLLAYALPRVLETNLTAQYLGLFALGMAAAYIQYSGKAKHPILQNSAVVNGAIAGLFVLMILLNHFWFKRPNLQPISDCVAGIWSALLLIRATENTGTLRAALSVKPLVWIGGFSYSLYLIHAPIVQILWQYAIAPLDLDHSHGYLLQVLVGIPLTIALAFGFSLLFERPFMTAHRPRLRLPG